MPSAAAAASGKYANNRYRAGTRNSATTSTWPAISRYRAFWLPKAMTTPNSEMATTQTRSQPSRAGPAQTPRPANPRATRPINPTFSPNKVDPKSGSRALKASRAGSAYCSSKPGVVRQPCRCNSRVGPSCQANNNPRATMAPPSRRAAARARRGQSRGAAAKLQASP